MLSTPLPLLLVRVLGDHVPKAPYEEATVFTQCVWNVAARSTLAASALVSAGIAPTLCACMDAQTDDWALQVLGFVVRVLDDASPTGRDAMSSSGASQRMEASLAKFGSTKTQTCNEGHGLVLLPKESNILSACDVCWRNISPGALSWRCAECGYDVCLACRPAS